nr:exosortase A [Tsuneonella deserti]
MWLGAASCLLFALTSQAWREMAHQWWNIDTYAHILLVPPIIAWLTWLRRHELSRLAPCRWWPGLAVIGAGLSMWLIGTESGLNLLAHAGAVLALQGAVLTILGLPIGLILAFPLCFAVFLVPFGDEIIPFLQNVTARIAVALTHASGVPAVAHGLFIDTPAGRFVVAEECSGVKFLIAMVALATLVAWTAFRSWQRRLVLLVAAVSISILANGVRAWATIFVAQFVGARRAGGFDHIVYGWVFFGLVIAIVLGCAWRFAERDPADAGWTAEQAERLASTIAGHPALPATTTLLTAIAFAFAVFALLV